jgi:hypothetical protein
MDGRRNVANHKAKMRAYTKFLESLALFEKEYLTFIIDANVVDEASS